MSHNQLVRVAAILVRNVAAGVMSLERIWRSGGNCNESSDGKGGEQTGRITEELLAEDQWPSILTFIQ